QGLLSLQVAGAPAAQVPAEQTAPTVQALPSLHGAVLFTCAQPVTGSQASVVQTLPSSQLTGECVQPVTELHPSTVHALPSSQLGAGPLTHAPPDPGSPTAQALASPQPTV